MIFNCPVCNGPIAMWAVREAFTCHHCRWALSSNVNRSIGRGVWVGCAAGLLLFGGLWLGLESVQKAVDVWSAAVVVGFAVGASYVNWAVRLVPLRPPRGPAQNDGIDDPRSLEGEARGAERP